jgi:hypothetical protein
MARGEVMLETSARHLELSRLSGKRRPSTSHLGEDQLERLLSCMGYPLEVVRRPVIPRLTRFERRSWQFHVHL